MGADIDIADVREEGGESVGAITVRSSLLRGVTVPPGRAPAMIDEYPILAVAAAFAKGTTVMRGIGELRVKESDRIARMAAGLAACASSRGRRARAFSSRVAASMACAGGPWRRAAATTGSPWPSWCLGLAQPKPVGVDAAGMIATSFPGFSELLAGLGATIEPG